MNMTRCDNGSRPAWKVGARSRVVSSSLILVAEETESERVRFFVSVIVFYAKEKYPPKGMPSADTFLFINFIGNPGLCSGW